MTSNRDQYMIDIFNTALEGGINYWAKCDEYHWGADLAHQDYEGFFATVVDVVDDEQHGVGYRIDRATISKGYRLAATDHRDKIRWSTAPPPLVIREDTDWDYDAGDADVIVQLGLFGEVLYG